jgi:hypothetical protein
MVKFLAGDLTRVIDLLDYWRRCIGEIVVESGPLIELSNLDRENVSDALKRLRALCERLPLKASNEIGVTLGRRLAGAVRVSENPACHARMVEIALEDILNCLKKEVCDIQFAFVHPDKVGFFEQHDLFGERVSSAFPSAQSEIQDAGNCLAGDLHTAAVFHLMRAAEHGLRALAGELRVRLRVQLEYAGWEEVIRAVDRKLTALRAKPRGKKKAEALEFYRLTLARIFHKLLYF